MAVCPKCGGTIKYEARRAGTSATSRNGSYNSKTKYMSVGVCPNCGYVDEKREDNSWGCGFLFWCFIGAVWILNLLFFPGTMVPLTIGVAVLIIVWKCRKSIWKWIKIFAEGVTGSIKQSRNHAITDRYNSTSENVLNGSFEEVNSATITSSKSFKPVYDRDAYFEVAAYHVASQKKATIHDLRKALGLDFLRAARLLDSMEEAGFVGPDENGQGRDVYVNEMDLLEYFKMYP